MLCQAFQNVQSQAHTFLIETNQGIIQHQRCLGDQFFCHRKAERQIQLIHSTVTAPHTAAKYVLALGIGADGEILTQRQTAVTAVGKLCKGFLCSLGNLGSKATLQSLCRFRQGLLGDHQGAISFIELFNSVCHLGKLAIQRLPLAQGLHLAFTLAKLLIQLTVLRHQIGQRLLGLLLGEGHVIRECRGIYRLNHGSQAVSMLAGSLPVPPGFLVIRMVDQNLFPAGNAGCQGQALRQFGGLSGQFLTTLLQILYLCLISFVIGSVLFVVIPVLFCHRQPKVGVQVVISGMEIFHLPILGNALDHMHKHQRQSRHTAGNAVEPFQKDSHSHTGSHSRTGTNQPHGRNPLLIFLQSFQICSCLLDRLLTGQAHKALRRLDGHRRQRLYLSLQKIPLLLQKIQLLQRITSHILGRKLFAMCGSLFHHSGGGSLGRSCGFHPCPILFRSGKFQSSLVVLQAVDLLLDSLLLATDATAFLLQTLQLQQLVAQVSLLFLRLGDQTGTVVTAVVFQFFQFLRQGIAGTAFVTGGDQGIQATAQGFVVCQRHIRLADKAGTNKDALFHTQKHLTAIFIGQFRHGNAGSGLKGAELTHGHTALRGTLNGDVLALPADVHAAGHGCAGPGGIAVFCCQEAGGAALSGLDAVKHGYQECTPGTFAPFIGGMDHVQTWVQGQGLVLQFAEGGCHRINFHGKTTS